MTTETATFLLRFPLRFTLLLCLALKALLCTVEARTTEEPDAGKLHAQDCTGGAG